MNISRREAIKKAALLAGGGLLLPDILKAWEYPAIQNADARLGLAEASALDALCETIIPATDTPGAGAAGVPAFIQKYLADCIEEKDRAEFAAGLRALDTDAQNRFGRSYADITPAQRIEATQTLAASRSRFWRMAKEMTVLGYVTSEIGCTQFLRYEPVPGRYDGKLPYKKGDRAWGG